MDKRRILFICRPWASSNRGRHLFVLALQAGPEKDEGAFLPSGSSRAQRMVSILHLDASMSTGESSPDERETDFRREGRINLRPDAADRQFSTLHVDMDGFGYFMSKLIALWYPTRKYKSMQTPPQIWQSY